MQAAYPRRLRPAAHGRAQLVRRMKSAALSCSLRRGREFGLRGTGSMLPRFGRRSLGPRIVKLWESLRSASTSAGRRLVRRAA